MLRILRFALAPAVALLFLGLAACGGDDGSGSATTATLTPSETDGDNSGSDQPTTTRKGTPRATASADLEAYFAEFEQIALRTDDKLEQIGSDLQNATFASDAEEIAATQNGLQQSGETIERATLDISDLDPPPEAEDAHADFIEKLQAVLQLQARLLTDTEDVSTSAELDALVESYNTDLSDADAEFDSACVALQGIADDHGIDADLRCTN